MKNKLFILIYFLNYLLGSSYLDIEATANTFKINYDLSTLKEGQSLSKITYRNVDLSTPPIEVNVNQYGNLIEGVDVNTKYEFILYDQRRNIMEKVKISSRAADIVDIRINEVSDEVISFHVDDNNPSGTKYLVSFSSEGLTRYYKNPIVSSDQEIWIRLPKSGEPIKIRNLSPENSYIIKIQAKNVDGYKTNQLSRKITTAPLKSLDDVRVKFLKNGLEVYVDKDELGESMVSLEVIKEDENILIKEIQKGKREFVKIKFSDSGKYFINVKNKLNGKFSKPRTFEYQVKDLFVEKSVEEFSLPNTIFKSNFNKNDSLIIHSTKTITDKQRKSIISLLSENFSKINSSFFSSSNIDSKDPKSITLISKDNSSNIIIPTMGWDSKGHPDLITIEHRPQGKSDKRIVSISYKLNYGQLNFVMDDVARYESGKIDSIFNLRPIKLKINSGETVLRKDDIVTFHFDQEQSIKWADLANYKDDSKFSFLRKNDGRSLAVMIKKDISGDSFTFEALKFILLDNKSFMVGITCEIQSKYWRKNFILNHNGIHISKLNIDDISNMPVYFDDSFPDLVIPLLRFTQHEQPILKYNDIIEIDLHGASFDVDKENKIFDRSLKIISFNADKILLSPRNISARNFSIKALPIDKKSIKNNIDVNGKLDMSMSINIYGPNFYQTPIVISNKLFHLADIDSLFFPKSLKEYLISPITLPIKASKGDTLRIKIDKKMSVAQFEEMKSSFEYNSYNYKMIGQEDNILSIFSPTDISDRNQTTNSQSVSFICQRDLVEIEAPSFIIGNIGSKLNYLLYEYRPVLGKKAYTKIYSINESNLVFDIKDYARYEASDTTTLFKLPNIYINTDNIGYTMSKGDKIKFSFIRKAAIWDENYESYGNGDYKISTEDSNNTIVFEATKSINFNSYAFEGLKFKLINGSSFSLKLSAQFISSDWRISLPVMIPNGIDVGRVNLIGFSHTPLFRGDSFPDSKINSLILSQSKHKVLKTDDEIEISIAGGGTFLSNKKNQIDIQFAKITKMNSNRIIIKPINGNVSNIILKNIPLVKDSNSNKDINIFIKVFGDGYVQKSMKVGKNYFHDASMDSLHYEINLPYYEIPSTSIEIINLQDGDSLYVRTNVSITKTQKQEILRGFSENSKLRQFTYVQEASDVESMCFIYNYSTIQNYKNNAIYPSKKKASNVDLVINGIKWLNNKENPSHFSFEYRPMLDGFGSTTIYSMKYGEISFVTDKQIRYENVSYNTSMQELSMPKMKLSYTGSNSMVQEGDQVLFYFTGDNPIKWAIPDSYSDLYELNKLSDDTLIVNIKETIGAQFIELNSLNFRLTSNESFSIPIKARFIAKENLWSSEYDIIGCENGISVGRPKLSIVNEEIAGIIKGRSSNRLPSIQLTTSNSAFTNKGDTLSISLLNDKGLMFVNKNDIRIVDSKSKVSVINAVPSNSVDFVVLSDFSKADTIIIENIRLDKTDIDILPVAIEFTSSATPIINKLDSQKRNIAEMNDVSMSFDNSIQYINDQAADRINFNLINNKHNLRTFWSDDYISILIPKKSGAIWDTAPLWLSPSAYGQTIAINNLIALNDSTKSIIRLNKDIPMHLPIIENRNSAERYTLKYKFDNDGKSKNMNLHELSFFDQNITDDENMFFSDLNFDMKEDLGIYAKDRTKESFNISDITIYQDAQSFLYKTDIIELSVSDLADLAFDISALEEISSSKNIELEPVNIDKFSAVPRKLAFKVNNVFDKEPIVISGVKMNLLYKKVNSESYPLNINYNNKFIFNTKKKFYVGSPDIVINPDTLIWPIDKLELTDISIDDSKSNIIGLNNKSIFIRIDTTGIGNKIKWSKKLEKDGRKIVGQDGYVLSVPISKKNRGKIKSIKGLVFSGLNQFKDVDENDLEIYLEFSFDNGANYYDRTLIATVVRLEDISFTSNCLMDKKITDQFLPTMVITENKSINTIKEDDVIKLEMSGEELFWNKNTSQIKITPDKLKNYIDYDIDGNVFKMIFRKNIDRAIRPGDQISISNLMINKKKNLSFNKKKILVSFESSYHNVPLVDDFHIVSTNLNAKLLSNNEGPIIYSYKDNEEFTDGSPINDYFNGIEFHEQGLNNLLMGNDTIRITFPYKLEGVSPNKLYSLNQKNELFTIIYNQKNRKIMDVILSKDISVSTVFKIPEPYLHFDYPDKATDLESLKFCVIKDYQPYIEKNNINIKGEVAVSANQPEFSFEGQVIKEFIVNDVPRDLPGIVVREDKFLKHLNKGEIIEFELSSNFPADWDLNMEIYTEPKNVLETNFVDDRTINFTIKKDVDYFVVKGMKIKNFVDVYLIDNNNQIFDISMNNQHSSLASSKFHSNYTFGFNYYTNKWKEGSISIGKANMVWNAAYANIDNANKAQTSSITILYENIENPKNIPDTFYLRLNTYNDGDCDENRNKSDLDMGLDVFKWDNLDMSDIIVKGVEIIDLTPNKEGKSIEIVNSKLGIRQSWIKCKYLSEDSKMRSNIQNLPFTSNKPFIRGDYGKLSYYNVSLHYDYPKKNSIHPIISEPLLKGSSKKICNQVEYSDESCAAIISDDNKYYEEGKEIALKIERGDSKFNVIFRRGDEYLPYITSGVDTVANGEIYNDSTIVFELVNTLKSGLPVEIENIHFDLKNNKKLKKKSYGHAYLKLEFDTKQGKKELYADYGIKVYSSRSGKFPSPDKRKKNDAIISQCLFSNDAAIPELTVSKESVVDGVKIYFSTPKETVIYSPVVACNNIGLEDELTKQLHDHYKQKLKQDGQISYKIMDEVKNYRKDILRQCNLYEQYMKNQISYDVITYKHIDFHYLMALTYVIADDCPECLVQHRNKYDKLPKNNVECHEPDYLEKYQTPDNKWKQIVQFAKSKDSELAWKADRKLNSEPNKKKFKASLTNPDDIKTFDIEYDLATIRTAIQLNDIVRDKDNSTVGPVYIQGRLKQFRKRAKMDQFSGSHYEDKYSKYNKDFKKLDSKWDKIMSEKVTFIYEAAEHIQIRRNMPFMKLIYKSDPYFPVSSTIYSSNYYYSENKNSRYKKTIIPYSRTNQEWKPGQLYDGGRYLLVPEHKSNTKAQRKYLRNSSYCLLGITLLKVLLQ